MLLLIKGRQEFVRRLEGVVDDVELIVICPARKRRDFFVVKHSSASGIEAVWIVNLNVFSASLNLSNNRIIGGVYIGDQLVKRLININFHHAGISVIAKHSAVLPHGIRLRLFAGAGVIDRMQSGKCNSAPQGIAADHNI